MKIGLALPHYDFSFPDGRKATMTDIVGYARRAEALGFDSVWISDHLFLDLAKYGGPATRYGTPEAIAMLTAVAAGTERVHFGPLVLCGPFRNPRVLAEQINSITAMSGGRLEVGLGAGWYEPEFVEAGIPFGTPGRRIEDLERLAGLLTQHLDPRPPVWIGGKGGPKIMRIVAEHADGWNIVWGIAPDAYRERLPVLDAACAAVGRDPATVSRSVGLPTLVGTDDKDVAARYERLRAWGPARRLEQVSLDEFGRTGLAGTPDACAARIKDFAALGVDEVILNLAALPFSVHDDEQLDLIGSELLPLVR